MQVFSNLHTLFYKLSEFVDLVSYLPKSTKVYYAHPYSFYESGTNEKQNFLVRRFFPKRTSFDNISDEQVAYVEHWINNFPREIFNYHCSDFIFRMSYLILQFREKYPQKINSFLWMWLVCPLFYPENGFHTANTLAKVNGGSHSWNPPFFAGCFFTAPLFY